LRQARKTYLKEQEIFENQIISARGTYISQISKAQLMRDKANKRMSKIEEDENTFVRESAELAEYDYHFKSKMNAFEKELEEMDELQAYLGKTRDHINSTV